MDNSETYFLQCQNASEIQNQRLVSQQAMPGDFFGDGSQVGVFCPDCNDDEARNVVHNSIWLPRQDQLQEMVRGDWVSRLYRFTSFAYGGENLVYDGTPHNVFTMEQLWLAFVMKELHNKAWTGGEWIPCK